MWFFVKNPLSSGKGFFIISTSMGHLAIIPAAGLGQRMGKGISKQYLEIGGKPILARTLEVFENSPDIDGIYLVVSKDCVGDIQKEWMPRYSKIQKVVAGGKERQDSVKAGFEALPPCEVVCVHDAVRPFLTQEVLHRVVITAKEQGAAILGRPIHETVKRVNPQGLVQKTVNRHRLWSIQTPQCFRYEILMEAFKKADVDNFRGTDEAMLVEYCGFPVAVIEGDLRNIKITTPFDLKMAENFLKGEFS